MVGLGGGKIGLDPDLVARLQVRNLGDGKRGASACDANLYFGPDKVKTSPVIGVERGWDGGGEKAGKNFCEFHLDLIRRQVVGWGCGVDVPYSRPAGQSL